MNCKKAQELISFCSGDDMPEGLNRHIEGCPRCRALREETSGLVSGLGKVNVPAPPEGFFKGQRADVRQGLYEAYGSGPDSDRDMGYWSSLFHAPLWRVALATSVLIIVLVSAYMLYPRGEVATFMAEAPLIEELAEADLELYMEADPDEVAIASLIIGSGDIPGSVYYDVYGLGDEELEIFYDSLDFMMDSM